ncbi:MAG: DUF3102 domain-containing protein [Gemmataceae bacterium]
MRDNVVISRPAADLGQLAAQINAEHAAAIVAIRTGIERARACGELLTTAKKLCAHGEWLSWLGKNCPSIGARQPQKYMRLASRWGELVLANANPDSHLPIDKALSQLGEGQTEMADEPSSCEQPDFRLGCWGGVVEMKRYARIDMLLVETIPWADDPDFAFVQVTIFPKDETRHGSGVQHAGRRAMRFDYIAGYVRFVLSEEGFNPDVFDSIYWARSLPASPAHELPWDWPRPWWERPELEPAERERLIAEDQARHEAARIRFCGA